MMLRTAGTCVLALASLSTAARAEPLRLRGDALATARAPAGLFVLDAQSPTGGLVSAEVMVWAGRDELGRDTDALVVAVRIDAPSHDASARLGRFVLVPGALRPLHLDGVEVMVRLPWDGAVQLFGGFPVVPNLAPRPFTWTGGGRIAQRFGDVATLGLAFAERREGGALHDRELGLDAGFFPSDETHVSARAAYDLVDAGLSELVLTAGWGVRPLRVEVIGSRRSPSRLLPATSLFSVLGDVASDRAVARLSWLAAPRLDVVAEVGALGLGGDWGEELLARARLRLDDAGDRWVAIEARRRGAADAAWSGLRVFGRTPITLGLAASIELEHAASDEGARGSPWPWGLA
ncbi:hypothetical protein L6R52_15140, partial [Myxococcota bacterium]|nr:hypothetical protein [Myxococcota bacterium]